MGMAVFDDQMRSDVSTDRYIWEYAYYGEGRVAAVILLQSTLLLNAARSGYGNPPNVRNTGVIFRAVLMLHKAAETQGILRFTQYEICAIRGTKLQPTIFSAGCPRIYSSGGTRLFTHFLYEKGLYIFTIIYLCGILSV